MSDFMKSVLLWAAIILIVCYLFRLNPVSIINGIIHAAQTVHNSQGG